MYILLIFFLNRNLRWKYFL